MRETKGLRSRLLACAATGLALVATAAGGAYAQDDADDEDADVIVVRGIRSSIASSIAAKRDSTSIVEAVSAEDIGKLPDVSIAESLARLPGLTAQRLRGRAQVISVRGLGPDFTTALLNGREQVTAGDNRGVEFDQYPAELLSQVLVYKTPDAQLVSQGLAGTADLRTVRPIAYGDRALSLNARYEWADIGALNAGSDDTGYRITGSYIDQFANDTVGIAIGFATQSTPTQAERWEAWGYPTETNGAFIIGGAKPYVESRTLDRDAVLGTLEFEPNSTFSTSIDMLYSDFSDAGVLRGIEFPLFWSSASLDPGYTIENGVVTQGSFSGVQGVVRNDYRSREAELFSAGWNAKWNVNDQWNAEFDLSYSRVERTDVDLELYAGTGNGGGNGASDTLGFSQAGTGGFVFSGMLDYGDPSLMLLTDPQGWGQAGFIKTLPTEDELTALRVSAEREFGPDSWISSVEGGLYYTQRDKNKTSIENFVRLAGGATEVPVPSELLLDPTPLSFIGIPASLSFDPLSALNYSGLYQLDPLPIGAGGDVVGKTWAVSEDVFIAYLQANIISQVGGVPVTGNFGVQMIDSDQSSTAPTTNPGSQTATGSVTDGDEYTDWLPSVNLSFEVAQDTFLRFGAAKTLARARMDQLRVSQYVNTPSNTICPVGPPPTFVPALYDLQAGQVCMSGNAGNARLRPYSADSYDLSFEHYFADGAGYVSIAGFYKEISDWVVGGQPSVYDFSDAASTYFDAAFIAANPDVPIGILYQDANAEGGWLKGLEFAVSLPAEAFLPEAFEGLGVLASYSVTDSEVKPDPTASPITIPGFSDEVGNITVYYETGGFEARVSNRWRSDFLAEVTGFGAGRTLRNAKGESVVDAQIGYDFTGGQYGWLDGISVLFQAQNITDEQFGTFDNGDPRQVHDAQQYGTTYLLGVNWRH